MNSQSSSPPPHDDDSKSSPPPHKKPRRQKPKNTAPPHAATSATSAASSASTIDDSFTAHRSATAASVLDFDFRKARIQVLRPDVAEVAATASDGILYWMSRDARVQDNWALLYAQKLALKNRLPLHVCYSVHDQIFPPATATLRGVAFLLDGLRGVAEECASLNVAFHLIDAADADDGNDDGVRSLLAFVRSRRFGCVVCDYWPLREPRARLAAVVAALPAAMAVCQVDAHNIVPVWQTSEKLEYAARTIRGKVNGKLAQFLQPFPPVIRHPHGDAASEVVKIDWSAVLAARRCDRSVKQVAWAQPGHLAAQRELLDFCQRRLSRFGTKRNDPLADAVSNLSPWLRFGQLSAQRCVLTVREHAATKSSGAVVPAASVDAYCEETVVRRELSENFCHYNDDYDRLTGASQWAQQTLQLHSADKRDWLYTRDELELARTHDDLWNAAQLQLRTEGKMHGFMRMYWAKKVLEWTEGPERALADALYLNDKWSLDGYSPNGFVGCMWSIGGVHDMGWKERAVFGKIRYMNYAGCKRKFDVAAFVARYGGKVVLKK